MAGVLIREAAEKDIDTFFTLVDALADYEKLPRPTPDARVRLRADGFGESRRFRAFLAELDGDVVGYAIVFDTYSSFLARPTLFLEDLFVLPASRGRGIARAFFRFLAADALRRGCGRMEWMVLDWNQLAIDFYERLGATRLHDWHGYRLTVPQLEEIASS